MPCAIKHSIMADEQGAQQVWSNTLSAPPGTSSWNFFFFMLKNIYTCPKEADVILINRFFTVGSANLMKIKFIYSRKKLIL